VSAVPPEARNTNLVFQHLSLFPHMTFSKNVGYGLEKSGPASTSNWSTSGATRTATQPTSRAASSSGWRWPARWSTNPRCYCSTNRSRRWTENSASRCRSKLRQIHERTQGSFFYVIPGANICRRVSGPRRPVTLPRGSTVRRS
jgi:hypothetical protein